MKNKEEDEDVSVNSEHIESEEDSVSEKLKIHCDKNVNVVAYATFSRRDSINSVNQDFNNSYYNESEVSIISNQIYSDQKYSVQHNRKTSLNSNIDSICFPSTSHNSHIQSSRGPKQKTNKDFVEENGENPKIKYYSPQKNRMSNPIEMTPEKNNKLVHSYNKHPDRQILKELYEETSQEEVKKAHMMMKLKEMEIKEMNLKYKSLKDKFTDNKKKLEVFRESLKNVQNANINSKLIICGIIKNKNNIII